MRIYLLLFFLAIFACNNPIDDTSTSEKSTSEVMDSNEVKIEETVTQVETPTPTRTLNTTFNDYQIQVKTEDGRLKMACKNPKGATIEMPDMEIDGNLKTIEVTDMNKDNRPEIFAIISSPTGEKVEAFSLTPFSSLPIYLPKYKLQNYEGADRYEMKDGQLVYSYATTDGGRNNITYNLVAGEAGFRLEPHGMTPNEMDTKVFGTYATEGYPNDYWQKLTISDNGLGEIVIKITASKTKGDRPDCTFESVGKLVDGKITALLNFKTEDRKGTMILTEIKNGWEVATVEAENRLELMYFCRGGASLAGEYLRIES